VLTALTAGFRGAFSILGEIAATVLAVAATALAVLAALAAGFRSALAIVGKIARTVLPAGVASARRLLAIFSKIAWITGVSLFSHLAVLPSFVARRARGPSHSQREGRRMVFLTMRMNEI
jgi:hypothetical protein